MDDLRLGRIIRVPRRRRGWRQSDLADAAGLHQSDVSEMERGHIGAYRIDGVRRVVAAPEATLDLAARWRGSALDRLLDERHAALAGLSSRLLAGFGWELAPEFTFSEFGERGSIDPFAARRDLLAVCVQEIKSDFVSAEATLRSLDVKVRLAPKLARERFGFTPRIVGRCLVLPEGSTSRRRIAGAAPLLDAVFPLRGHDARRWLAHPVAAADRGPVGIVLFLPGIARGDAGHRLGGPDRVRPATSDLGHRRRR